MLSAYHDGELPPDTLLSIEDHCALCEVCATELLAIRQLSTMAGRLKDPTPPADLWSHIARQLPLSSRQVASQRSSGSWRPGRMAVLAASVVAFAAAGVALYWAQHRRSDPHVAMAANFSEFLTQFESHPEDATSVLAQRYAGTKVSVEEAARSLRYRPAITDVTPSGCSLESVYLMYLPCCKCIQATFRRDDGGRMDVFEHDEEQQAWFGDRPCIRAQCAGEEMSVTQLQRGLAATWKIDGHFVTVVGARDLDEIVQFSEQMAAADRRAD